MDLFKKFETEERIFRDERLLMPDYIPDELPHREREIDEIAYSLKPILNDSKPENIVIIGQSGTGKTTTVKYVANELESHTKKALIIYINCWEFPTRHGILTKMISSFGDFVPRRGIATDELLEKLSSIAKGEKKTPVVILDEVDRLEKESKEENVLYDLARSKEVLGLDIAVIAITNDENFSSRLDSRIRVSLLQKQLHFKPYTPNQLRDILKERAKKALRAATYDDDVIGLCVAYGVKAGGDARTAISSLWRAGRNAEREDRGKILPEDVKRAYGEASDAKKEEQAETLNEKEKRILELLEEREWTSGELGDALQMEERLLRNYIANLEKLGFIEVEKTRIGQGWSRKIRKKSH